MSTIITRASKGSALSHAEMDANLNNLNADKVEKSLLVTNNSIYVKNNSGVLVEVVVATDRILGRLSGGEIVGLTVAQIKTLITYTGKQNQDDDLDDIAALTPANGDIMQRVGGVWTAITMADLRAAIAWHNYAAHYAPGTTNILTIDVWTEVVVGATDERKNNGFTEVSGKVIYGGTPTVDLEVGYSVAVDVAGSVESKKVAFEIQVFNGADALQYSTAQSVGVVAAYAAANGVITLGAVGVQSFQTGWYIKLFVKNVGTDDDINITDYNLTLREI